MPISTDSDGDIAEALAGRVREAAASHSPLRIRGGGSKAFLGREGCGETLELSGHRGIIAYHPSELVITARAGTPLAQVESVLAQNGQMLPFEPPAFGPSSTLGGVVAAGLSGARRPFAGAVRDSLLGVQIIDGRGRVLHFGGVVFKNVAGFDAFRLMAGAFGTLGVLLEVSLRLLPSPAVERTVVLERDWPAAKALLTDLMRQPLPLSGAMHQEDRLFLRFSGSERATNQAAGALGGEPAPASLWSDLRHMRHPVLTAPRHWRLSLPRTSRLDALPGSMLRDWAGAQCWLASDASAHEVRAAVGKAGGHATLFRGAQPGEAVFHPLPAPLFALHQRIKAALDPVGVLNPGRMWEGL